MSKVRPEDAKNAIIKAIPWVIGLFEALEGIEQGSHPIVAVKNAVKKAKKRKKKEKIGKKLRKSSRTSAGFGKTEVIDVEGKVVK